MRTFQRTFTYLVLLFLYIPMVVLAVASFNAGTDPAVWKGFTLHNYSELFADGVLLPMLLNSVIIAVLSSLIATVLGTAASIGMHDMKPRLRSMYMTVTNIPMTNPDIVTGVSLALLFAFAGTLLKMKSCPSFRNCLRWIRTCRRLPWIWGALPARHFSRWFSTRLCPASSPVR